MSSSPILLSNLARGAYPDDSLPRLWGMLEHLKTNYESNLASARKTFDAVLVALNYPVIYKSTFFRNVWLLDNWHNVA